MICVVYSVLECRKLRVNIISWIIWALPEIGRAMRYNLFARASQKGFPLLSLTQRQEYCIKNTRFKIALQCNFKWNVIA